MSHCLQSPTKSSPDLPLPPTPIHALSCWLSLFQPQWPFPSPEHTHVVPATGPLLWLWPVPVILDQLCIWLRFQSKPPCQRILPQPLTQGNTPNKHYGLQKKCCYLKLSCSFSTELFSVPLWLKHQLLKNRTLSVSFSAVSPGPRRGFDSSRCSANTGWRNELMNEWEDSRGNVGGLREQVSDFTNIYPSVFCSVSFLQKL